MAHLGSGQQRGLPAEWAENVCTMSEADRGMLERFVGTGSGAKYTAYLREYGLEEVLNFVRSYRDLKVANKAWKKRNAAVLWGRQCAKRLAVRNDFF